MNKMQDPQSGADEGGTMGETTAAPPVTPDSPLLHAPRATLAVLTKALLSRPHGTYRDEDVRFIARLYNGTCRPLGLDPLVAVAQMRLETGNLSSPWSQPPHHNPAGIGVTGAPGAGISFPSWAYSARAHIGRLLAYALTRGTETPIQRLVIAEALYWRQLPAHLRGVAPTLRDLAGRWAADPEYGVKIAKVANEILGVDDTDGPTAPSRPRIITARSMGLAFKPYKPLGPALNVTGHYSGGRRAPTWKDGIDRAKSFHRDHAAKGWGGIGYHYLISDDGALICGRPTILKGFHTKKHNSNNIGVNMPATTGDRPTEAQAETFRWLLANAHTGALPAAHRTDRDLRRAKRWGHKKWPDNSTLCPGLFLRMYLSGGKELIGEPEEEPEAAPVDRPEPVWRGRIFVDFEHIGPEEAEETPDPDSVDAWLPPADPRFDFEDRPD
jgi:hypothetical protein